ncbi:putative phage replisome organizer [Clostridium sporogenes]|uniref:Uncharacterized protein n=1 Tax=Clostridium sporogenes TaxID=1509 RepID=A0A7U4JQ13_CLOSG|nr:hypothetical protein [Clostridium sporogenes]AKC63202.1 hypothetical protein CLSPO_c24820 [Clostridium sporogenes]KCZ67889.1 hypothetical protein CSPO_7c02320 [Clostridium sporogenes]NFG03082.1 hypothetical protein [Clostridium sporogenes]OOO65458.1 hypothetical protein BS099_14290 [Clostridium sporogenes]SQC40005.1 putative phage replisome organizer [Clostridium sporogenes]
MKYTIHGFNQEKAIELGLDNDDLLILRYFIDFKDSGAMVSRILNDRTFYWIKYEAILEQLPILKLKKDSVYRRLKKMCKSGILEHKTIKKNGTYSFYSVGKTYIELVSNLNPSGLYNNGSDLNPNGVRKQIREGTDLNPDQKINLLKDSSIKCSSRKIQQEVINYYCSKALTTELHLKPMELEAINKIIKDEIRLEIVKQGIDLAFKKFKPSFAGDKIKSFKYCEPIIRGLNARINAKEEGEVSGTDRGSDGQKLRDEGIGI